MSTFIRIMIWIVLAAVVLSIIGAIFRLAVGLIVTGVFLVGLFVVARMLLTRR